MALVREQLKELVRVHVVSKRTYSQLRFENTVENGIKPGIYIELSDISSLVWFYL